MASQPEPVKFPLPPSPVAYDTGPQLRALITQQPVTRVELPDGSAAWLVTGFDEVREVRSTGASPVLSSTSPAGCSAAWSRSSTSP